MKRDFPASEIIINLIHSMKPGKWYFAFEIREISFDGYRNIRRAVEYSLIQKRHVFGRVYQYQLTEKGILYRNKIHELGEENFIKEIKRNALCSEDNEANKAFEEKIELSRFANY